MSMGVTLDEHLPIGSSQFRDGELYHHAHTIGELREIVASIASTAKRSLYGFEVAIRPRNDDILAFNDDAPPPKRAWAVFEGVDC